MTQISPAWPFKPGDSILRKSLHDGFGGGRQGGVEPSRKSPNVFIFTDPDSGSQHGYIDGWKSDGCFHYTGEGQRGDQRMVQGNSAILHHKEQGRRLRVFDGADGLVKYLGEFEIASDAPSYYTADAPETQGGPLRSVIIFRLRPVDINPGPTSAPSPQDHKMYAEEVPVEESQTERFVVEPNREPYEAERREALLVKLFIEFLQKNGQQATRLKIVPRGEAKPIFCDIFVRSSGLLVEAKGSIDRNSIRMALGQLLDYSRFVECKERALLLPTRPRDDLVALLEHADVGLFYPTANGRFAFLSPRTDSKSQHDPVPIS